MVSLNEYSECLKNIWPFLELAIQNLLMKGLQIFMHLILNQQKIDNSNNEIENRNS